MYGACGAIAVIRCARLSVLCAQIRLTMFSCTVGALLITIVVRSVGEVLVTLPVKVSRCIVGRGARLLEKLNGCVSISPLLQSFMKTKPGSFSNLD